VVGRLGPGNDARSGRCPGPDPCKYRRAALAGQALTPELDEQRERQLDVALVVGFQLQESGRFASVDGDGEVAVLQRVGALGGQPFSGEWATEEAADVGVGPATFQPGQVRDAGRADLGPGGREAGERR
jgi:hypothetical protein